MTTLLQLLVTQSPTLLALIAGFYVLYQKIQSEATLTKERFDNVNTRIDYLKENLNTRIDDVNTRIDYLKENLNTRIDDVNTRIDDLKENTDARLNRIDEDYRTLNAKMDTMSAQISRIEGALSLPRTGTED